MLCGNALPNWFGGMVVWTAVWTRCFPALRSDSVVPRVHPVDPVSAQSGAFLLPAARTPAAYRGGGVSAAPAARLRLTWSRSTMLRCRTGKPEPGLMACVQHLACRHPRLLVSASSSSGRRDSGGPPRALATGSKGSQVQVPTAGERCLGLKRPSSREGAVVLLTCREKVPPKKVH